MGIGDIETLVKGDLSTLKVGFVVCDLCQQVLGPQLVSRYERSPEPQRIGLRLIVPSALEERDCGPIERACMAGRLI